MNLTTAEFWLFAALTAAFAVALIVLIFRRLTAPKVPAPTLAGQGIVAQGVVDAQSLKTIADAIAEVMKALGEFAARLDAVGPAALLGFFTVFFAFCTLAAGFFAH